MTGIDDIMKGLAAISEKEENNFSSKKQAYKAIEDFENFEPDFKVGDYIERNELGISRYAFPRDNMVCKVVAMGERNLDISTPDDGIGDDMIILCALNKDTVKYFSSDSRYYKKASEDSNVCFLDKFKKR